MNKPRKRIICILFTVILLLGLLPIGAFCAPATRYNHIDVRVDGNLSIVTQLNGVQQGSAQKLDVTVTAAQATVNETVYPLVRKTGIGAENEWRKTGLRLSMDDSVSISYTISYTLDGNVKTMTCVWNCSDADLRQAVQNCPNHSGFDFNIAAEDVTELITHTITFQTEDGGTIDGAMDDIVYTNILQGNAFPTIPAIVADPNYAFAGWFDEQGNPVTAFPATVEQDATYVAKWNSTIASYRVEHYLEQKDGSYLLDGVSTQELNGTIGATINAVPLTYRSHRYNPNAEGTLSSGQISQNPLLVLKLYYDRVEPEIIKPITSLYLVEHYLQQEDGTYELQSADTQRHYGKIGETVFASPNSYEEYHLNDHASILSGKVVMPEFIDNTPQVLTLKLYYDSDIPDTPSPTLYHIVYKTETGGTINGGTSPISSLCEAGTTYPASPILAAKDGYEFIGWYREDGTIVTEFPQTVCKNATYTAKWKALSASPLPKTGDMAPGMLLVGILLLSAFSGAYALYAIKRDRAE